MIAGGGFLAGAIAQQATNSDGFPPITFIGPRSQQSEQAGQQAGQAGGLNVTPFPSDPGTYVIFGDGGSAVSTTPYGTYLIQPEPQPQAQTQAQQELPGVAQQPTQIVCNCYCPTPEAAQTEPAVEAVEQPEQGDQQSTD